MKLLGALLVGAILTGCTDSGVKITSEITAYTNKGAVVYKNSCHDLAMSNCSESRLRKSRMVELTPSSYLFCDYANTLFLRQYVGDEQYQFIQQGDIKCDFDVKITARE